jgi:predicted nucleotidyltransferase
MIPPTKVSRLLDDLLDGVSCTLNENLLGFYLRGSLALGEFDPATSDIDVLVVTHRPVSSSEFDTLSRVHTEITAGENRYARRLEVSYIDRAAIKRFAPEERRHPTIGTDWPFGWAEHRANWILERWVVRKRGVALLGPDPKTLIDPISPEELGAAVRDELRARLRDWAGGTSIPDWLLPRYYQAFEVETVCRALYTVAHGELPTKARAVEWAIGELPEPWRSVVEQSQEWRSDRTEDPSRVPEVMAFVRWATSEVEAGT